jgi:tetratricopeptide (TPR) repeat protein
LIDARLRKIGTKTLRAGEFRAFKKAYSVAPTRAARTGLYGKNSLRAAEMLDNTGRLYSFYGKFKKAIEYFERARKIFERAAGCDQDAKSARENGPETGKIAAAKLAACLVNIGNVDYFKGNYETALEYYEKAAGLIDGRGEGFAYGSGAPADIPLAARISNDMGVVYLKLGRFDRALELIGRGLELRSRHFSPDHPAAASSYNNLGNLYLDMEEYEKALEYFGRALKIRRACYGASHPSTMTSVNDIGDVYLELGEYEKALENYSKALKVRSRTLGARHPAVATCLNNLGLVHSNLGEYEKALECHRRSLKIKLFAYGPKHPYVAITYHNMGSAYSDMGEYEKALGCFEHSLEIDRGIFGGERPRIVETHNHIAEIYTAMGRFDEAVESYKKVALIIERNDNLKRIYLVTTLSAIGRLYLECADLESAGGYFEKALKTSAGLHGENHADTSRCYFDMGLLRLKMRDYSGAVSFFSRAAAIDGEQLQNGLKASESEKFSADFLIGMLSFSSGDLMKALGAFEKCKSLIAASAGACINDGLEDFPQAVDEYISLIRRKYRD